MKKKYITGLKITGFLLMISLILMCSYLKYLKDLEKNSPLVLVKNGLSINYLDGFLLKETNEETVYKFSVTNNTLNDLNYTISLEEILNAGKITYDLIEKEEKVKLLQKEVNKNIPVLAENVNITPKDTHFYTLTIYENSMPSKINIYIEENKEDYFANIIKDNNEIKNEATSKWALDASIEDEGLIKASSDEGPYYYFRGNVSNNYVSFANLKWRITRINSDDTIRLILDDYTDSSTVYYEDKEDIEEKDKLDFLKNKIYNNLNNWYQKNLEEYENYIITSKYCVDDSILNTDDNKTYYVGNSRILKEYNESHNCLGTTYTSRIGILSADEVIFAGASSMNMSQNYYLYIPNKNNTWWTSTPSYSEAGKIYFFEVDNNGRVNDTALGTNYKSVRPVINLTKKVTATGTGTDTDPYVIKLT